MDSLREPSDSSEQARFAVSKCICSDGIKDAVPHREQRMALMSGLPLATSLSNKTWQAVHFQGIFLHTQVCRVIMVIAKQSWPPQGLWSLHWYILNTSLSQPNTVYLQCNNSRTRQHHFLHAKPFLGAIHLSFLNSKQTGFKLNTHKSVYLLRRIYEQK